MLSTRNVHLVYLFMLLSFWAQAQNFTVTTNAKEVVEGQGFEIVFTIENDFNVDFSPPNFSPAKISEGPSSSQQTTIINGTRTSKKTYSYVLYYQNKGTYTIPPATLKKGSKTIKTKSVTIKVLEAGNKSISKDEFLYMESKVSDTTIYVGQQFFIDQHVFFNNLEILSPRLQKGFDVDQFILYDVRSVTQSSSVQTTIDGKLMQTALIGRMSATPLRSGDMFIPEMFFNINVVDKSRPRRNPYRKNYVRRLIKLDSIGLTINPLPEGAPASFTGAVGRLSATSSISKGNLTVGKEILVQLEMIGNGLKDQVSAPEWKQNGFEIYDPQLKLEESFEQNGEIVFRKVFEYIVIPQEGGKKRFEIPFAYFDTDKEEYIENISKSTLLTIKGDASSLTDATSKDIQNLSSGNGPKWYEQFWFWGLIVLLAGALIFYFINKKPKEEVVEITEEEAALLVAKRQLAGAKNILDSGNTSKYWETLESSLRIYLEEKIGIGTTAYSMERVESFWSEVKFPQEQLGEYKSMIEKINLARYAGQSIDDMKDLYKVAEQWIVKVERL